MGSGDGGHPEGIVCAKGVCRICTDRIVQLEADLMGLRDAMSISDDRASHDRKARRRAEREQDRMQQAVEDAALMTLDEIAEWECDCTVCDGLRQAGGEVSDG